MKKMKCFRKMLALILALMMVFSAVSALAEGEDPEENQEPEVVDGEGTPENPENPKNPENPEVTENSPEGGTDSAKDAVLRGEKESGTQITTSVNITENTDGKFVYNKTEPVDVDDSDIKITYTTTDTKPTTEIIVKKDIQAENGHAIEIFCESQSESPESKLFLEAKDLSSNSENKSGLSLKNNRDDLTVSVGNVTGTDSGAYIVSGSGTTDFTCENAESGNNGIDARNSSPELTIKAEDVKGKSGNGITITNTGTSATADIGKAEGGYAGIEVNNQQGKTTVTASGRVSGGRNGIRAINLSGGTVEIKTGDIDVNNTNTDFPAIGVNVDSMNKKPQSASFSTGSITVTKQADSGKEAFGAYLKGRTELVANGDITVAATGTQTSSTGICVVGASDIIVTGSVTAKSEDGTAKGLWLKTTDSAPSAKADVLIEDTLSADTAIRLDSEDSAKIHH